MNIIEDAIDKQFEHHTNRVRRLQSLREVVRMAEAAAGRFGGRVSLLDYLWMEIKVQLQVVVCDFRDAAPIIEFVEGWTPAALVCDKTTDWPQDHMRQRDFDFGDRFRLCCELRHDSDACKAVLKGYKEPEPIYEFECAEAA